MTIQKNKEKLFKELRQAVKELDNEAVHGIYDEIIRERLSELDPSLLRRLNIIVRGIDFWYA